AGHKAAAAELARAGRGALGGETAHRVFGAITSEEVEELRIPPKHGATDTVPGRGSCGTVAFGDEKSSSVAKLPIWGDASRGVSGRRFHRHSISLSADVWSKTV